jgi:hypothetical protein
MRSCGRNRLSGAAFVMLFCVPWGVAACKDGAVSMIPVNVHGLPVCPQDQGLNRLLRPLVVEASADDDRIRRLSTGTSPSELGFQLPGREQAWSVHFGLCSHPTDPGHPAYSCGEPDWYAEVHLRAEHGAPPRYTLNVPPPPDRTCWRGEAVTE